MRVTAQNGPDAIYVQLAPDIVSAVRSASSPGEMTEKDMTNYAARREKIQADIKDGVTQRNLYGYRLSITRPF
jgi:gamma-glutamyltranspeptidase